MAYARHLVTTPLPIDPHLMAIVDTVRKRRALVIVAEPGAGKTTRVPPALFKSLGSDRAQKIVVVEPRRLAARLAAQRVAQELGVEVGGLVGYQVRFENRTSTSTRITFVTDGVMLRQLLSDSSQIDVGAFILDEFHERRLEADLTVALLRRLQQRQRERSPDAVEVAIVVMSATLEAEPVAAYLDAEILEVAGRQHPVEIEHAPTPDTRRLEIQVSNALRRLRRRNDSGHTLVFLPGAAEIRRCLQSCSSWAEHHGIGLEPLHGNQPLSAQVRALAPSARSKVILSTNVAETSITIDGVVSVIDSGLARVAKHSPWSGLQTLQTVPISQASAAQRAGRSGRTGPGVCLRLYTESDFVGRRAHEVPEIQRADLAEMVLLLRSAGLDHRGSCGLVLFDPLPPAALQAAEALLVRLGALDSHGAVTELGRLIARLPIHPRLGRLAIEAALRGARKRGCVLAALLQERDIRLSVRTGFKSEHESFDEVGPSDCLARLEAYEALAALGFTRERALAHGIDWIVLKAARNTIARLERVLSVAKMGTNVGSERDDDQTLLLSTLAAFPDRVGARRRPRSEEVVFAAGGSGVLSSRSVVREDGSVDLLVAVEAQEARRGPVAIHTASAIENDWLVELFPERVEATREVRFNPEAERVEAVEELRYDALVLDRIVDLDVTQDEATPVLVEAALDIGPGKLFDTEKLARLKARVDFASDHVEGLTPISDETNGRALALLCERCRSFAELRRESLHEATLSCFDPSAVARLARVAPEFVSIPGRRRIPVQYETGRTPYIESYLQDFFGEERGPTIGDGKVPLVLHLLAPNRRAVQVTTDLVGFWTRHYPSIRKELQRRYTKHAWPQDPRTAKPTTGRRRRR